MSIRPRVNKTAAPNHGVKSERPSCCRSRQSREGRRAEIWTRQHLEPAREFVRARGRFLCALDQPLPRVVRRLYFLGLGVSNGFDPIEPPPRSLGWLAPVRQERQVLRSSSRAFAAR